MKMTYSYGIAAELTASSPCSNVPIHCPLCPKANPAIWKYFMKVHFEEKHKNLTLTGYEHLWKLSHFERSEMKKIWARRGKVTTKRTKKSKIAPLTISDDHHTRIPANPSWSPSPEVDKTAETCAKTEKSDTEDEDMPEHGEDVSCVVEGEGEDSEEVGEDAPKHDDVVVNNFGDFGMDSMESVPITMQEPSESVSD